ncbi:hypothetical protein PK98_14440 [Croceibacterium mercuriale]|uniref:Uncharacterized protein n=1 Tax=Croceibacterium mercuriale TaxID=1572751 RepID=A0A0B2BSD0_9SPHN|nr:hypothetical protein PK98_14440 [Croceibacterium mercuriale]
MVTSQLAERFDPADAATWIARGRSPPHAEALAKAWRDFPDLAPTAPLEDRMARTRARVVAMRPVNDAIAAAAEGERQRTNFAHVEGKDVSGSITDSDRAILRGRADYGYDWETATCYSQGWYAAHAGWSYGKPGCTRQLDAHRAAYDRGFADGGGDPADLFDAARRSMIAADRTGEQTKTGAAAPAGRPLPSSWPRPTDDARPARWHRRLLILADDPAFEEGSTSTILDQVLARPEAEQLNIVLLTAGGFTTPSSIPRREPLTTERCDELATDPEQTATLRHLTAGLTIDDILVAAQGDALAVIDAHASALPLCRSMERTRNTVLQQRQHLKTWLDRAATGTGNVGAGHIRWSKLAQGLSGKLGEFTVRYGGKAVEDRRHIIVVETTTGTPATGYVTADGRPLDPRVSFGSKTRMRQEMAAALRSFGGATQLAPTQ